MKKNYFIILLFTLLMFMPLFKIDANVCSEGNMASFNATTCDFSVGNSRLYRPFASKKCKGYKYEKAYTIKGSDILAVCYPSPDKKEYFFTIYAESNGKCVRDGHFQNYYSTSDLDYAYQVEYVTFGVTYKIRTKKWNGTSCPKHFYLDHDLPLWQVYDYVLTDDDTLYYDNSDGQSKALGFLWKTSEQTGGGVVLDERSENIVVTCVNSNIENLCINNPNSSQSDIENAIVQNTSNCTEQAKQEYGFAADDNAIKLFNENVSKKLKDEKTAKLLLECNLIKKCSAFSSLKSTNRALANSIITGFSMNAITSAQTLIDNGVSEDLANCLVNNVNEAKQKAEEITNGVSETVNSETSNWGTVDKGVIPKNPNLNIDDTPMTCTQILGNNLTNIVKSSIIIIQIVSAIIAIVKGMITLIPAIASKDTDGLKKAQKELITMAIILVVIFLLKPLIAFIGQLFEYDLSCIL